MKTKFTIISFLFFLNNIFCQTFPVSNIVLNGDPNRHINFVILGDGYSSSEQTKFNSDAVVLTNYLFSQQPFSNYANYFNVYTINVVSTQSGINHPKTATDCRDVPNFNEPTLTNNPYLGSTFDYQDIHRLVVPTKFNVTSNVLATNFPNYDHVIILSNSIYYGGSGGAMATTTLHPASKEILVHELGHSFGDLADEYYAGDNSNSERINLTQNTNPATIKWKNWLNTPGIGIYQHAGTPTALLWYRPTSNTCKMQNLGTPFCSVCKEAIIEKIHSLVNPIVEFTPSNASVINSATNLLDFKLTKLMIPSPNTLSITWTLDGTDLPNTTQIQQIDQTNLTLGTHTLSVKVTDNTSLVNVNNHTTLHLNTVKWTINKTVLSTNINAEEKSFSYNVYPNPSSNELKIHIENPNENTLLSVSIFSIEGKLVKNSTVNKTIPSDHEEVINISDLANGTYIVQIKNDNIIQNHKIIKQN